MSLALLSGLPETAWPYIGGGVLVLWTVREFLAYMKTRHTNEGLTQGEIKGMFRRLDTLVAKAEAMERRLDQVFEMHDHVDEDGVYVWHLRRSFVRTVQALEDSQGEIVELLQAHGATLTTHGARLDELCRRGPGDAPGP